MRTNTNEPRNLALRLLSVFSALSLVVIAAGPATAATHHKIATHIRVSATPTTAKIGATVAVTATITPRGSKARVQLQRLVGGHWKTLARQSVARTGKVSFTVHATGKPATWTLRLTRPATALVAAGTSRSLHVRTTTTAYAVTATLAQPVVPAGAALLVSGSVRPKATGVVVLQDLAAGAWVSIATGRLTRASTFAISSQRPSGTYRLRVVKAFSPMVAAGTSKALSVRVSLPAVPAGNPSVTTSSLPAGTVGTPYSATLAASGGVSPYTWTSTVGLPPGLVLTSSGALSGTPSTAGSFAPSVTVKDSFGHTGSATLTVAVVTTPLAGHTVVGWGLSPNGELGPGYSGLSRVPVHLRSLAHITAVAAGQSDDYALASDGSVWAWGDDDLGQLGDGSLFEGHRSATPVKVPGLPAVKAIAASSSSSTAYALSKDGTVWAWGPGGNGELGNGGTDYAATPVQVSGLTNVVSITAGGASGYATTSDGHAWAWGNPYVVGNGAPAPDDSTDDLVPVRIAGLSNIKSIAAGSSAYAVAGDGSVSSWGDNAFGQLGDGTTDASYTPVTVKGGHTFTAVAAGTNTAYGIDPQGSLWIWGDRIGQLTTGEAATTDVPVRMPGVGAVRSVAAAGTAGFAVLTDGTVRSWGHGLFGVLGIGVSTDDEYTAQVLPGLSNMKSAAAGATTALALNNDGTVWTWGDNTLDELGTGDVAVAKTPVAIQGVPAAASIASGPFASYAVATDGSVWAWGSNDAGELGNRGTGNGATVNPSKVVDLTSVVSIAAGGESAYALRADGTVWAWGDNSSGQLGDGTTTPRYSPVQVLGLHDVTAVAAGASDGYALEADGSVWSWGDNSGFELGTGESADHSRREAARLTHLPAIASIAAGVASGYALGTDGVVRVWGVDEVGEQDEATSGPRSLPVPVDGLPPVTAISASTQSVWAVTADHAVWSWEPYINRYMVQHFWTPTDPIAQRVSGATAAAGNDDGGYALLSGGSLWSWGLVQLDAMPNLDAEPHDTGVRGLTRLSVGPSAVLALQG